MSVNNQRAQWVDLAKLIAIVAVLIDHSLYVLYTNQRIRVYSYFSVGVFIITMGVTSYWSYSRYAGKALAKVFKNFLKIVRPYLVATFIYSILSDHCFVFDAFLNHVVHFDGSLVFYYVSLYIQLLFVAPLLYYILQRAARSKHEFALETLLLLTVIIFASFSTTHSFILNIYGGGGKLFGGTYLILFYLGMLFGKHFNRISLTPPSTIIAFCVMLITSVAWGAFIAENQFQLDSHLSLFFGSGGNPPSISLIVYTILITSSIYLLDRILRNIACIRIVYANVVKLGQHTLYIFLYHVLFLHYLWPFLPYELRLSIYNSFWGVLLFYCFMIAGSLIIEYALETIHAFIIQAYNAHSF